MLEENKMYSLDISDKTDLIKRLLVENKFLC